MKSKCDGLYSCLSSAYKGFGISLAILDTNGVTLFAAKDLQGIFKIKDNMPFWAELPIKEQQKFKKAFYEVIAQKRSKCNITYTKETKQIIVLDFYFDDNVVFVSPSRENKTNLALLSEEKLSSINKISDGIAHNFRSPLTTLKSIAEYIGMMNLQWNLDYQEIKEECVRSQCKTILSRQKAFPILNQMKEDINSAVSIMSDIIDGLRIYHKSDRINGYTETDIIDLLSRVVRLLEYNAHDAVKLVLTPPKAPLPLFWCIPSDIQLVFINIIENAIQQIMNNNVQDGRIEVKTGSKNGKIVVSIKDNAGGISRDLLRKQKLFEPFISGKQNGSGLGLFISAKTIKSHGGEIIARNYRCKQGHGAEFIVTLPIML